MWIRIDEGFATHPKILAAGPLALAVQMRGICYASQHQTDGFLPRAVLPLLFNGIDQTDIEQVMVSHGLWEPITTGYTIHDYLHWNLSKRERERWKNRLSRAGKKGMKRRWGTDLPPLTDVITQVITKDITSTSTSMSKKSSLSSPEKSLIRKGKGNGKTLFPDDWSCNDSMQTFAQGFGINAYAEFARFRDHALATGRICKDWPAAFRNWIRKSKDLKEKPR